MGRNGADCRAGASTLDGCTDDNNGCSSCIDGRRTCDRWHGDAYRVRTTCRERGVRDTSRSSHHDSSSRSCGIFWRQQEGIQEILEKETDFQKEGKGLLLRTEFEERRCEYFTECCC